MVVSQPAQYAYSMARSPLLVLRWLNGLRTAAKSRCASTPSLDEEARPSASFCSRWHPTSTTGEPLAGARANRSLESCVTVAVCNAALCRPSDSEIADGAYRRIWISIGSIGFGDNGRALSAISVLRRLLLRASGTSGSCRVRAPGRARRVSLAVGVAAAGLPGSRALAGLVLLVADMEWRTSGGALPSGWCHLLRGVLDAADGVAL
jgi:hypothetical protein